MTRTYPVVAERAPESVTVRSAWIAAVDEAGNGMRLGNDRDREHGRTAAVPHVTTRRQGTSSQVRSARRRTPSR